MICVRDSIARTTDVSLYKDEDIVVCLPGVRIKHVAERIEHNHHGTWTLRAQIGPHRDEKF